MLYLAHSMENQYIVPYLAHSMENQYIVPYLGHSMEDQFIVPYLVHSMENHVQQNYLGNFFGPNPKIFDAKRFALSSWVSKTKREFIERKDKNFFLKYEWSTNPSKVRTIVNLHRKFFGSNPKFIDTKRCDSSSWVSKTLFELRIMFHGGVATLPRSGAIYCIMVYWRLVSRLV